MRKALNLAHQNLGGFWLGEATVNGVPTDNESTTNNRPVRYDVVCPTCQTKGNAYKRLLGSYVCQGCGKSADLKGALANVRKATNESTAARYIQLVAATPNRLLEGTRQAIVEAAASFELEDLMENRYALYLDGTRLVRCLDLEVAASSELVRRLATPVTDTPQNTPARPAMAPTSPQSHKTDTVATPQAPQTPLEPPPNLPTLPPLPTVDFYDDAP